ncbi:hypothetical protein EYF80_038936 [Liparis tanakae]|uniref:Uncharacterized protein n=1 Tax=Liparis tanakae TaxID=230148 RepID=A0A4Z2GD70_9TELE|nr:hypothetical protein EYF80_038936 [Liparis tanakae]
MKMMTSSKLQQEQVQCGVLFYFIHTIILKPEHIQPEASACPPFLSPRSFFAHSSAETESAEGC